MKSQNRLTSVIGIILLSISSIYPFNNINKDENTVTIKECNIFCTNPQLNWSINTQFKSESYCILKEFNLFNDRARRVNNTSKNGSYDDDNGNYVKTEMESGVIEKNTINNDLKLNIFIDNQKNNKLDFSSEKLITPTSLLEDDNKSSRSTASKLVDWYIPKTTDYLTLKSPNLNLSDVVQEVVFNNFEVISISMIDFSQNINKRLNQTNEDTKIKEAPKSESKVILEWNIANNILNKSEITFTPNITFINEGFYKINLCNSSINDKSNNTNYPI